MLTLSLLPLLLVVTKQRRNFIKTIKRSNKHIFCITVQTPIKKFATKKMRGKQLRVSDLQAHMCSTSRTNVVL